MPRRRKCPSLFRCLSSVLGVSPVLAVLWAIPLIMGVVCKPGIQCPPLPQAVFFTLFGVFAVGALASIYWAYRDFVQGHYWIDRADAGYL